MRKDVLLKLIKKALIYRLMANLDRFINAAELTHREISSSTAKSQSWFNDAFNNNEDIYISTLTKVLSVIHEKHDLTQYRLIDIFDQKILKIALTLCRISDEDDDEHIRNYICSEKSFFLDLFGDWASINYKNKLNEEEKEVMLQVKDLISN